MIRDKSINERVKYLRVANRYSQQRISEYLGMKISSYSQMERQGVISAAVIKKLSILFNVSTDSLIFGKETKIYNTEIDLSDLSQKVITEIDNRKNNRYCFLDNISDKELKFLKIVFLPKHKTT